MKLRPILATFLMYGMLYSCVQTEQHVGNGSLSLDLSTNNELITKSQSTSPENNTPSVDEFSLSVSKGEEILQSWPSFESFPGEIYLPVGTYSVAAWYGDIEQEGFDKPSYYGDSRFNIADNELTTAEVVASLSNVKTTVEYTQTFKEYFTNYTTKIASSKNNEIAFSKTEKRPAYFKPGALNVEVDVVTQTGVNSTLHLASLDQTTARSHYHFKLDIDAGSGSLLVTFDSTTVKEPITINVSDDALTLQPPTLTATGFVSDEVLEHIENMPPDVSELSAVLYAKAGIRSLEMHTNSPYLLGQGFPERITFSSLSNQELSDLESWGLRVRGVGSEVNMAEMALVDLMPFVARLKQLPDNSLHEFSFKAIDKNSRVAENLILKVNSLSDEFQMLDADTVSLGANAAVLKLRLKGDPTNITFAYVDDADQLHNCDVTEVLSSVDHEHAIRVEGLQVENKLRRVLAYYFGEESDTAIVRVKRPRYDLKMDQMDAWAKHAYVSLANIEDVDSTILAKYVEFFVRKQGEVDWIKVPQQMRRQGDFKVAHLEPASNYELKSRCLEGEEIYTQTISFQTEAAPQLSNAGFESWYFNITKRDGSPIVKNKDLVYWRKYFPWSDGDASTQGWSTINEKTTQDGNEPTKFWGNPTPPYVGCCYVANSGTVPTKDCIEGASAALIRSVGWGSGSAAAGGAPKKTDAGHLFLGSFNQETRNPNFGIPFTSRPSGFSFMYKYSPYNKEDKFIAKIVVLDAQGETIASGQMPEHLCGAQGSYVKAEVTLDYVSDKMMTSAASMYISFVSGTKIAANNTDFSYPPAFNLSDGEFVGSQLFVDDVQLIY